MLRSEALAFVEQQVIRHHERSPTLGTLMEEVAELTRALEGKHEHSPALELVQIASIAINMLRAYDYDHVETVLRQRNDETAAQHAA